METRFFPKLAALVCLLTAALVIDVRADDSEFHYVRPYSSRVMNFTPRSSFAFIGGQVHYLPSPTSQPPVPNNWLSFRHPYTHAYVSVPVALPNGTPKVEHRSDRLIYDYGFVAVVIHFVRDGSVNVSYDPKNP